MNEQDIALHIGEILMAHKNRIAVYFDGRFIGSKTEIDIPTLLSTPERFVVLQQPTYTIVDGQLEEVLISG